EKDLKMEEPKSIPVSYSSFGGSETAYNFNGPKGNHNGFAQHNDPEMRCKRRVASYKVFAVEGKLNSFRWLNSKFDDMRY
ncbi:hypothetical protein KI387_040937, partial [Taxus chinensis]